MVKPRMLNFRGEQVKQQGYLLVDSTQESMNISIAYAWLGYSSFGSLCRHSTPEKVSQVCLLEPV